MPNSFNPKCDLPILINDYLVYLNATSVKHDESSNLEIDFNEFGSYDLKYVFKNRFTYILQVPFEVMPFVGVEDNKEYDLGITISGNAKVRINGERIDLPYAINKEGLYHLELEGKNGVTKELNIEVLPITSTNTLEEHHYLSEATLLDHYQANEASIDFEKRTTSNPKKQQFLFAYLLPLIVLVGGVIIIKRGGK